ncbi:MAG TPA: DNA translocase FtsK [Solirubrobacteraceae bacterium]|jgi:S-DNA-T family DNA segregation ATPase FtsK/SpoIIIE|nr:DNA translocase FtsK [Solirubrobacteraceae bacterium]
MPTKRKKPKRRAKRARPPHLEQRHWDLVGLGLVAFAVFLAFVLYRGRDGGDLGEATVEGLTWLIGDVAYAVPVALAATGAILVLRPVLPAVRPFRSGGLCLLAAALLWLGAGSGGRVGALVEDGVGSLVGGFGVDVLAIFFFLAAVLLLTGASIAGVVKATSATVADTTRSLKPARRPARSARPVRVRPPEPAHDEPRVTRRVDDPAESFPDLFEPTVEEPPEDPVPAIGEEEQALPEELEDEPSTEEVAAATRAIEITEDDLTPQGRYRPSVTDSPEFEWRLPAADVLTRSSAEQAKPDTAGQAETARNLVEALGHFGVDAKVIGTVSGPHITRYELRLAPGIKMSKVAQLKDDLAYALAATDIRILAPIPGKTAVGVEVPNLRRRLVHLGDVFTAPPRDWSPLTVWLGKDVAGKAIGADLTKMPHLLVAGTTGAGKSACVNAMLSSVLLNASPHELRLVLVDPKQVELNHYEGVPHLLTPVITSPRMAANALQNLVKEMEDRYGRMSLARTRNLPELNRYRLKHGDAPLPYILCVIDELADLMMVAPADVEDSIIRLAQKARAVGIHLVLATQSPRVDVITGMIKANVPSRIAFAVSSQTDSRVILDQNGAETLLGKGDMLFSPVGSSRLQRIQGAYIDEAQIAAITEFWRQQGEPELREELLEEVEEPDTGASDEPDDFDPDEDPLLEEAIHLVAEMGTASTSMLQRRLRLGYTRAGRLIDMLERRGVISGYEGSKPRQVLVSPADVPRFVEQLRAREGAANPE